MNWFPFTYILDNLITNSIHAWLTKDYRSSGMPKTNMEADFQGLILNARQHLDDLYQVYSYRILIKGPSLF